MTTATESGLVTRGLATFIQVYYSHGSFSDQHCILTNRDSQWAITCGGFGFFIMKFCCVGKPALFVGPITKGLVTGFAASAQKHFVFFC